MDTILAQIRQDLVARADPAIRQSTRRFFREEILCYGIRTAEVNVIAKLYWKKIRGQDKEAIFSLCEELYRTGCLEESVVAAIWARDLSGRLGREDLAVYRHWIDSYISSWASCDGLCNHAVGDLVAKFPECTDDLKLWTLSENRWMRRAAAVSLIVPAKHGRFQDESLAIADLLLADTDDMVQKGYGWLLKEVSRKHNARVFAFVMERRERMPRTALRYAIELLPAGMKTQAMQRA